MSAYRCVRPYVRGCVRVYMRIRARVRVYAYRGVKYALLRFKNRTPGASFRFLKSVRCILLGCEWYRGQEFVLSLFDIR